MSNPDVTIVLFRPDMALFRLTVRSLAKSDVRPRKVWLLLSAPVDDSIHDEIRQLLHDTLPPLSLGELVSRPDNLGFAAGHNFLLNMAFLSGATWSIVLNPDVQLTAGSIGELLRGIQMSERANPMLHGPRLVLHRREHGASEEAVLDSDGVTWTRDRRHFDIGQGEPVPNEEDSVRVDGISGAVLGVTKRSWEKIVGESGFFFDPVFLAYREDAELGLRVERLGGENWVHRRSVVVHARGSLNAARGSELQRLLGVRNRFILKSILGSDTRFSSRAGLWRDLVVVCAVVILERSSIPGLVEPYRVRRSLRQRRIAPRGANHRVSRVVGVKK